MAVLMASCGGPRPLVVGSKNFTEQLILGEIAAQHLERRLHLNVQRRLDLGGTLLAHEALVAGHIDVYPEYTGTALTTVLKLAAAADAAGVLETVRSEYARRFGLRWLDPLGFNDSFAMVVRGPDARAHQLKSLTDAARCCPWRLGVGYEFLTRPDGLARLTSAYPGLRIGASPQTMDLGLLYRALEQKQVDLVAANTTDGLLAVQDLTVLDDDAAAFPPYQGSLVAREAALRDHVGMEAALQELSGRISDATMRKLNYEVDGKHRSAREVAAEFLATAGL
ncbi:MAG TPA: glycine betaine ABC transporter substrate-binding protein [Bryobacteraceae bacterium]|nr:glycine betaine ABC transporter substrate-binding protein [Bryobacteraceae bacterium]